MKYFQVNGLILNIKTYLCGLIFGQGARSI